jgi:hypothetical protein
MEMEDLTKAFLQWEIILEHNMSSSSQHIKEANAQFGFNRKMWQQPPNKIEVYIFQFSLSKTSTNLNFNMDLL